MHGSVDMGPAETLSYCRRALLHGYRIVYLNESIVKGVIHHDGEMRQTLTVRGIWLSLILARKLLLCALKLAFTKLRDRSSLRGACAISF